MIRDVALVRTESEMIQKKGSVVSLDRPPQDAEMYEDGDDQNSEDAQGVKRLHSSSPQPPRYSFPRPLSARAPGHSPQGMDLEGADSQSPDDCGMELHEVIVGSTCHRRHGVT